MGSFAHLIPTTVIQSPSKHSISSQLRLQNIEWIRRTLSRDILKSNLVHGKKEKQMLILSTRAGEELFIQYPGKESRKKNPNPVDFRPKLFSVKDDAYHGDLSFGEIWEALHGALPSIAKEEKGVIRMLAALLYRMAFMLDHKILSEKVTTKVKYLSFNGHERDPQIGLEEFEPFLRYDPPKTALDCISEALPIIAGMSVEAFLHYNEILTWNEDCKYFIREESKAQAKSQKPRWISVTGRINTLSTHIHILGCIVGDVRLAKVYEGFANGRGVSPAKNDDILTICKGFVKAKS